MKYTGNEGAPGKGGQGGNSAEEKTYTFRFGGSNFVTFRRKRAVIAYNPFSNNQG